MARLVLLFLISITVAICNGTSDTDIENAKNTINAIIDANQIGRRRREFPFIAGFVRLAFHDCVGVGHCDGCVNHTLPDNAGLKRYTDALDIGFNAIGGTPIMSRADFYALAALTALERATATDQTPVKFTALKDKLFRVGRKDCPTSPNEDKAPINPLPGGHFDTDETLDFFTKEFGFTAPEVVALLGAHTLGRCSAKNSGFEGKWVTGDVTGAANSDMLNNLWYERLLGKWTQVPITFNGQTKLQWQRFDTAVNIPGENRQAAMFLNSDISLVWNISPVASDGTVACEIACRRAEQRDTTINCCDREPRTDPTFRTYVNDNVKWMQDFTSVFMKMIDFGATDLTNPITPSVSDVNKALDNDVEEIVRMLEDVKEDLNAIKANMN